MNTEACAKCRYWRRLDDAWQGAFDDCDTNPLTYYGFCRRLPPKETGDPESIVLCVLNEDGSDSGEREAAHEYPRAEFPITESHNWCGEYACS
jgi:hypothetical protein